MSTTNRIRFCKVGQRCGIYDCEHPRCLGCRKHVEASASMCAECVAAGVTPPAPLPAADPMADYSGWRGSF